MRNCLSNIWNKQFLIFLFFLLLSSAFWIFQALNEVYEHEFKIRVELVNVPKGTVITTDNVPEIEMTLRDRGVTLLNYQYGFNFKPIHIDYNTYANPSGHVRILTHDLLKQASIQMASSTQILSTKPDTIEYYYNHGLHKRVPVIIEGEVKAETGYMLSGSKLSHDSVTIYAPSSLLEKINAAYVKLDYLKSLNESSSMKLKIQPVRGVKFIPNEVSYKVFVDRLVEKKIKVNIQPVGFPENTALLPIPLETEVIFQIGMNLYRDISADDFSVIAHYDDMPKDGGIHYPLRLTKMPKAASRPRLSPNKVEYLIEKINPANSSADSLAIAKQKNGKK